MVIHKIKDKNDHKHFYTDDQQFDVRHETDWVNLPLKR